MHVNVNGLADPRWFHPHCAAQACQAGAAREFRSRIVPDLLLFSMGQKIQCGRARMNFKGSSFLGVHCIEFPTLRFSEVQLEIKELLTLVGLTISLGGLVISLVKLAQEQRKANEFKRAENEARAKSEKRTEYKLRMYQLLIDDRLTFDESVSRFREHTPTTEIDQLELRKCIYEMLVDGTLVTFEDKTYTADTMDDLDDE